MTTFSGSEGIKAFLEEFDSWLAEPVTVSLIGGSAMTVQGLKDRTEDIDFALGVVSEFEHVCETLETQGFTMVSEPTTTFEDVGTTVELEHTERGIQIDLFERQILGKVWFTDRMRDRADVFWTGTHATTLLPADEDLFLLKAVSGGDLASGRRRDLDALRSYARGGLDYEVILTEIAEQRPFNTGQTEAQQIRDRSHPLFTIEIAVESISDLPGSFTSRIEEFGTEFEIEYTVLAAADDGIKDVQAIRDRVETDVRTLSTDQMAAVDAAIDRLAEKQILQRDGDTVELV